MAVTELRADAPIEINADRMESVALLRWLGHLVHETVHHIGIPDDERRLPDLIGVAVETYVSRQWNESDLGEFGHPEDHVFVMNLGDSNRPARMLLNLTGIASDTDLTPNPRVPICARGETFRGQNVGSMFWRVSYLRGDQGYLYLRGSAPVSNVCLGGNGHPRRVETTFILNAELAFWERFENRAAWWTMRSQIRPESLAGGNYDGVEVQLDLNRTFAVESLSHATPTVAAGGIWRMQVIVYSTDDFVPTACHAVLTGARWFYHRVTHLAMFDAFEKCAVTALGGDRYQVDIATGLPANTQPDLFRLSFLYFEGGDRTRYAIPGGKPQFVEVTNPTAPPPMKGTRWNTTGLEGRASMLGVPIKNSFRVMTNEPFTVDFEFEGSQSFTELQFIDVTLLMSYNGEIVHVPWNQMLTHAREIVTKMEVLPRATGTTVRLHMVLPPRLQGLPLLGIKLYRVSLQTDDYTWVEANIPTFLEGLFLTDEMP